MESKENAPDASVDRVVMARIADALERIAAALENAKPKQQADEVPFPWHEVKASTRQRVQEHYFRETQQKFPSVFKEFAWPLSCEALVKIGPHELAEARLLGDKGIQEIRELLAKLGFTF